MKPEQSSVSVVLLGIFKPSDFTRERLRDANVLSDSDVASSEYELLVPEQAIGLKLPWGKISVVSERLTVETSQVPYIRAGDLTVRLCRELSPGSIVAKMGINTVSHYRFADASSRDQFAGRFVPARAWGSFGKDIEHSFGRSGDQHGGLMRVTMRKARPDDRSAGWLDATIEPSPLVSNDQGVQIGLNDHYEWTAEDLAKFGNSARAISDELLQTLSAKFDDSVNRSLRICDELTGGST